MCQNSMSNSPGSCGSNDYSLQTAENGVAFLATNALTSIITGSQNGTVIKSIKIVATGPVTLGKVGNSRYLGIRNKEM